MVSTSDLFLEAEKAGKVKDYDKAIELYKQAIQTGDKSGVMVARNLLGRVYERVGNIDEAQTLYEANAKEGFDGTHPYERLAIIYKKQKRTEDEINILKQAIDFFQRYYNKDPARIRVLETISHFKTKLDKALKRQKDLNIAKLFNSTKETVLNKGEKAFNWFKGATKDAEGFISKQAKRVWKETKHYSVEGAMAVTTVLSSAWSHDIATRLADTFNRVPGNVYDKAIDSAAHIGGPRLHHLVDGQHSITGAFQAAHNALPDDSFAQEVFATAEHLFRDLCSVSGINPVTSISKDTYDSVAGFLSSTFHIPRSWTSDMLTINGVEVIASAFVALPLIFGWSKKQSAKFSEMAGSLGVSTIASANPLLGLIALVTLAKAYVDAEAKQKSKVAEGTSKGAIFSSIVLGVSAIIGGPIWLGLILGIVIAFVVRKKLSDTELLNGLKEFLGHFYDQYIKPNTNRIVIELEGCYKKLKIKLSFGTTT